MPDEVEWVELSRRLPLLAALQPDWLKAKAWKELAQSAVIGFDDHFPPVAQGRHYQWVVPEGRVWKPNQLAKMAGRAILLWSAGSIANNGIEPALTDAIEMPPVSILEPWLLSQSDSTPTTDIDAGSYFFTLATGANTETIVAMLKAFSLFKKRMKSQMALVLALSQEQQEPLAKLLRTYKYREDVILKIGPGWEDLANLVKSAYALLVPVQPTFFTAQAMVFGLQAKVPILCLPGFFSSAWAPDACLPLENTEPGPWSQAMQELYKNETWRSELTSRGWAASLQLGNKAVAEKILSLIAGPA
jgi:hypothetical protein